MRKVECLRCKGEGLSWIVTGIPPREELKTCPACQGNGFHYFGDSNDYYECNIERKGTSNSSAASKLDSTAER